MKPKTPRSAPYPVPAEASDRPGEAEGAQPPAHLREAGKRWFDEARAQSDKEDAEFSAWSRKRSEKTSGYSGGSSDSGYWWSDGDGGGGDGD